MSDGMFVAPIVTDDGRVIGWGRGPEMVVGAAYHRDLGTDLRFLRLVNGVVATIDQSAQDAIIAADQQAALAAQQADQQAAIDAAAVATARAAEVEAVREQYRAITRTICQLAGVAVVDKFDSVGAVADVVMQYGMGENALQLTQYALFLKATLDELRRMDGDDAWERV